MKGKPEEKKAELKAKCSKEVLKTLGYEFKVEGEAPSDESCILVGNHVSYLDIPVVIGAAPKAIFISKDNVQKWPLLGPTGTAMGTIFVSRDKSSNRHQARNAISEILRKRTGEKIVVFPSGTTSLDESKPWKK